MRLRLEHVRGFDFHCHIDLDKDPAGLISQCEGERIVTIGVTTTPMAWSRNVQWTRQSPYVRPAIGLHPELVGERYEEIELLVHYMPETRLVGEVGLDGSPQHQKSYGRQKEVFVRVLKTAQALGGRVLTIHSRRAIEDVAEMLGKYTTNDRVLPILHWFSGSGAAAERAAESGCYFSVNGAMMDNERGEAIVRRLPPDRLLTETDSPFTQTGKRSSSPWDVLLTADRMAVLFGLSNVQMSQVLAENAARVLSFAGLDPEIPRSLSPHRSEPRAT